MPHVFGVQESPTRVIVEFIHYKVDDPVEGLPPEIVATGWEVAEIPERPASKIGIKYMLVFDPTTGVFTFEEVQRPLTVEEKLIVKEAEVVDLQSRLTVAEEDNINTMLALTEVYEMMLGGTT